ncbi:MAG TPA: helix-turn-helix transcriptional regulator [Clostridiaceae bacterium]|nr:helix-turn-helix transcriptional regulator [Clostridiaceae bacterium]
MARLGDIIKSRRERMGLSLREFANICGLSHAYISKLEGGDPKTKKDIMPSISSLEKLAPVLSMSMEELLKEIGYIDYTKKFEPSNLKLLRNGMTYEQMVEDIAEKTGESIDPMVYEALEKGLDKNPSPLFIDVLAKYANVDHSFFYRKNTPEVLEYCRHVAPYTYEVGSKETTYTIKEDLKEFVLNPENEDYLRLAKELCDKKLNVKFIREVLFKD